jgi:hypothetical protein
MKRKFYPVSAFASNVQSGMDLRDYFAATALESLINVRPGASSQTLSSLSYELADAMMTQRHTSPDSAARR